MRNQYSVAFKIQFTNLSSFPLAAEVSPHVTVEKIPLLLHTQEVLTSNLS
jgi:hypothetical protein